ncbi:MAG: hypothetical protein LBH70_08850 [Spirochaetaceae bacterium]|jgi:hypothetical protein|nr:hypothetical protein [Spirochaetaceae bacterium]
MGVGLLKAYLEAFEAIGAGIADKRRDGYDKRYEYADAIKGAYGIFFFQPPSMPDYPERLKKKKERSNVETVLKGDKIPGNNQITRLLDGIEPGAFGEVFEVGLETARKHGGLDRYLVLNNTYRLVTLDGVWFYQSKNITCPHCLHRKLQDGETLYYHDMAAAALVRPGVETVLPLVPEFIRNEDGEGKQDCERNAAGRRLEGNAERYRRLNPVFSGDDLYANYPVCAAIGGKVCILWLPASRTAIGGCMIRWERGVWRGRRLSDGRGGSILSTDTGGITGWSCGKKNRRCG